MADLSLPSPAQLALAIVILKHKPVGLAVHEYLNQLRRHKQSIQLSETSTEPQIDLGFGLSHHEVDTHTSIQHQLQELEKENLKLKQELALLGNKPATRKRERISEVSPTSKRLKAQPFAPPSESCQTEIPIIKALETGPLTQCLLELGQLLSRSPVPLQEVAAAVVQCCIHSSNALTSSFQSLLSDPITTSPRLNTNIGEFQETLSRVEGLVKVAAKAIKHFLASATHLDEVVFNMISLFKTNLDMLHTLTNIQSQDVSTDQSTRSGKRSKPQANTKRPMTTPAKYEDLCAGLANILATMVQVPASGNLAYTPLIEAFACLLLEHAGENLSILTFGPQLSQGDDIHLDLRFPWELRYPTTEKLEVAKAAALIEAPYIIYILQKLMKSSKDSPSFQYHLAQTGPKSSGALTTESISRLQSTLLRGVFGKQDNEFSNALGLPTIQPLDAQALKLSVNFEQDSPKWFLGKIWDLVGWQMLAQKIPTVSTVSKPGRSINNHDDSIENAKSKAITTTEGSSHICYCQGNGHGKVIQCHNSACPFRIFHLQCIGLKRLPANSVEWLCARCRNT